jgi:predicted aspartyl protease
MGVIAVNIRVRNILTHGPVVDLPAKVDTAATLLVLPGSVAEELGLPTIRRQNVKYANETTAERDVVYGVELEVCERRGVFEAIIEPAKTYALLGAVVMETLDLIVEPRDLRVYPNPRSRLPMAEIE